MLLDLPDGGHLGKKQSAITPGSAPNFHHRYLISINDIVARFLI
jgi:hypothetical protein